MESCTVPWHMTQLANQTVKSFGYDTTQQVDYCFNSLGFRSPEPSQTPSLAVVGNSVSFGLGVPMDQTFGCMLGQHTGRCVDNRSFGSWAYENHQHIENLKAMCQQDRDLLFVIQINNLDRRRVDSQIITGNSQQWCVNRFLDFFDCVETLLESRSRVYVYWDDRDFVLPQSVMKKIAIKNQFHLDSSIPNAPWSFGCKSHRAIGKYLRTQVGL